MAELVCRWCKNSNVKALGENTQCFDCGRIAESLTYAEPAPEPEVEVQADQTPEEAEEAAALAAEIEAEEQAAAEKAAASEKKPIPGLTTTASLNSPEVAPKPGPKKKP